MSLFVGCETGLYSAARDRQDKAGATRTRDTDSKNSGKVLTDKKDWIFLERYGLSSDRGNNRTRTVLKSNHHQ